MSYEQGVFESLESYCLGRCIMDLLLGTVSSTNETAMHTASHPPAQGPPWICVCVSALAWHPSQGIKCWCFIRGVKPSQLLHPPRKQLTKRIIMIAGWVEDNVFPWAWSVAERPVDNQGSRGRPLLGARPLPHDQVSLFAMLPAVLVKMLSKLQRKRGSYFFRAFTFSHR